MPHLPEITVIVVSYNHADFVRDALDSVAAQTHVPAHIIVIDDASTDGSSSQIDSWASTSAISSHLVLNDQNRGLCRNLNAALALVTTPLYAYISADDRMLPHRLERQARRWADAGRSAVAVYSDAHRINYRGERLLPDYREVASWDDVPSLEGRIFDDLLAQNWIPAASVLLDTVAVVAAGGYDEELFYEDHDLWLRLARAGNILCVDEPLVEVRELASSLGATTFGDDSPKHQAARLRIMLKHFGASSGGDRYLGHQVPALAVQMWEGGDYPEIVASALTATNRGTRTPGIAARLALLRVGVNRDRGRSGSHANLCGADSITPGARKAVSHRTTFMRSHRYNRLTSLRPRIIDISVRATSSGRTSLPAARRAALASRLTPVATPRAASSVRREPHLSA